MRDDVGGEVHEEDEDGDADGDGDDDDDDDDDDAEVDVQHEEEHDDVEEDDVEEENRSQDREAHFARACTDETNAHGHVTRAILCGNSQERCRAPIPGPTFRASLRS